MNQQDIDETIRKETQGLPFNALQEILDFIQFIKIKICREIANKERKDQNIRNGIKTLDKNSITHLENEFADYKELYPYE